MPWLYLLIAGLLEIGWPLGMKIAQTTSYKVSGIAGSVLCLIGSGIFLWFAQKEIPIGTAYAVWTGIGASGTFIVGILLFGDSVSALRIASVTLIIAGIVGLKLAN